MKRPRWLHPRRSQLARWLETGESEWITAHVEDCSRCAAVIEELAGAASGDDALGGMLREALAPPVGLGDRVSEEVARRVEERERTRRDLQLLGEMFGIGIETARSVLAPPPEPEEGTES
ncbi:MAG: hypothetical protein AAGA99_15055 [Actinomycetota bacterium]